MDEFKLLIIGGEQEGIRQSAEFNALSRLVRTQVVSGSPSFETIYRICLTDGPFDGIHIAGHLQRLERTESDRVMLTDTEYMEQSQVASIVSAARAKQLFLSACDTATVGTYVALNSQVHAVIYTTREIADSSAWEFPERFYRSISLTLRNGKEIDFGMAFLDAVAPARTGVYSLISLHGIGREKTDILVELKSVKALLAVLRQEVRAELADREKAESRLVGNGPLWLSILIYASILGSIVILALALGKM